MAWFGRDKKKQTDPVRQYSEAVEKQIAEARKLLETTREFDPKNKKHVQLVKLILDVAANIPESRMADARSNNWNEAKREPFTLKCWSDGNQHGHSFAQRLYYGSTLVIDWVSESDKKEAFETVRLGTWCEELFSLMLEIRGEIESLARTDEEELARRAAEHEANRYMPLN